MDEIIKDGERIDDLQLKGLKIIQNPNVFCFGMDAVLLSSFVRVNKDALIADLGTGNGILPLLIYGKKKFRHAYGLEIQGDIAGMAERSVRLNGLQDSISIVHGDILRAEDHLGVNRFHAVICNPPYSKANDGYNRGVRAQAVARQEILCGMDDIVRAAWRLLMSGGRLFMIQRSDRFAELIFLLKENRFEPKRIRMIQPFSDKPPNLFMVEAVKLCNPGVLWEVPLVIYSAPGQYTEELRRVYGAEEEDNAG